MEFQSIYYVHSKTMIFLPKVQKRPDVLKLSKEAMIPSIRLLALPRVAVFSCSLFVKILIIERTFCNMNI